MYYKIFTTIPAEGLHLAADLWFHFNIEVVKQVGMFSIVSKTIGAADRQNVFKNQIKVTRIHDKKN